MTDPNVTPTERDARYLIRLAKCMEPLASKSGFWAEANAPANLEEIAGRIFALLATERGG